MWLVTFGQLPALRPAKLFFFWSSISVKANNENLLNSRQTCAMHTRLYTEMEFQMSRSLSWCMMTLLIMRSKWWMCTGHKLYGYYKHTIATNVFSVCSSFLRKAFKTTCDAHGDILSMSTIILFWNVLLSFLSLTFTTRHQLWRWGLQIFIVTTLSDLNSQV